MFCKMSYVNGKSFHVQAANKVYLFIITLVVLLSIGPELVYLYHARIDVLLLGLIKTHLRSFPHL